MVTDVRSMVYEVLFGQCVVCWSDCGDDSGDEIMMTLYHVEIVCLTATGYNGGCD